MQANRKWPKHLFIIMVEKLNANIGAEKTVKDWGKLIYEVDDIWYSEVLSLGIYLNALSMMGYVSKARYGAKSFLYSPLKHIPLVAEVTQEVSSVQPQN